MVDFDDEKVLGFVNGVLSEHKSADRISEILNIHKVDEATGEYVKVGFRPLLNGDIFEKDEGEVHLHSHVYGLGRSIALGELSYFVKQLENHDNVIHTNQKLQDLKIKKLQDILDEFDEPIIISSEKKYELIKIKEWYDWFIMESKEEMFFGKEWHIISSKLLGDSIWVMNKYDCIWSYVTFMNQYTKTRERVNIEINETNNNKVDALLHSTVLMLINKDAKMRKINLI